MAERGLVTSIQAMTIICVHQEKKKVGIHQNDLLQKLSIIYGKGINAKQLRPHIEWHKQHKFIDEVRISIRKVLIPRQEGINFLSNLPTDLTRIDVVREYYDKVDRLFD